MLVSGLAVLVIVAFALSIDVGEVVSLETSDETGQVFETELWVVEHTGALYVRGGPSSRWLQRLRKHPVVTVQRDGRGREYRALTSHDPIDLAAVNTAMAEKYGPPDWILGHLFERSERVVIRLEPWAALAPTGSIPGAREVTP